MNEYRIGMYILIPLLLCGVFWVLPVCVGCLNCQPEPNCYLNLEDVSSDTSDTTISTQRTTLVENNSPVYSPVYSSVYSSPV